MEDIHQAVPCCVRRKASYDVAPTMPRCSDSYLVSTSDFLPTIFTNPPSFVTFGDGNSNQGSGCRRTRYSRLDKKFRLLGLYCTYMYPSLPNIFLFLSVIQLRDSKETLIFFCQNETHTADITSCIYLANKENSWL